MGVDGSLTIRLSAIKLPCLIASVSNDLEEGTRTIVVQGRRFALIDWASIGSPTNLFAL